MSVKRFKLEYLPNKVLVATVKIPIDLIKNELFWKNLVMNVLDFPVVEFNCINFGLDHDLFMSAKDPNGSRYIVEEKRSLERRVLEFYREEGISNNLKLTQL